MNAQEINDLCKPLLDRIGWPEGLGFYSGEDYEGFAVHGIEPVGESEADFLIEDRHAAALIRCHIMDWLAPNGWDICLTGGAEDIRAAPLTNRMLAVVRLDKFPTPLHALVAVGTKATEVAHV